MTKVIIIKTIGIDNFRYPDKLYYDIILYSDDLFVKYFTCNEESSYNELIEQIESCWKTDLKIKTTSNKVIYSMLIACRYDQTSFSRKDDIIKFQLAFNLI